MFPAFSGIQGQGRKKFNHPVRSAGLTRHFHEDLRGRHEYIEYFEDLSASGGLKFEPNAVIGHKGAFLKGFLVAVSARGDQGPETQLSLFSSWLNLDLSTIS
jgi:hypothetical protein